jgi:hypothetical protein
MGKLPVVKKMVMKKNILFILFLCSFKLVCAQDANFLWVKQFGGTGTSGANSMELDASGNIYTIGGFSGTVDFNPGSGIYNLTSIGDHDIFVSKLDSAGNFIWAKQIGGQLYYAEYDLALDDAGNTYITGTFWGMVDFDPGAGIFNLNTIGTHDLFVLKLDSFGNFIWAKQIGGPLGAVDGTSISLDDLGNIYTTGYFADTIDFDPGAGTFMLNTDHTWLFSMFVLKLNPSGNFVWAKAMYGPYSGVQSESISIDRFGNVLTIGQFHDTVDFDPGVGSFTLVPFGSFGLWDAFISKLDSSGNFVWAKQFWGESTQIGFSITTDAFSNVYTTGVFDATTDFDPGLGTFFMTPTTERNTFISKLDAAGNFVWAKQISGYSHGNAITLDAENNVYTTGYFDGYTDFDPGSGTSIINEPLTSPDTFIAKYDGSGNFIWVRRFVGAAPSSNYGASIGVDAFNNIYTTGWFQGTSDFDPSINTFNFTSSSETNAYIHKMCQGCSAGISEGFLPNNMSLYPNPTNGPIHLTTNDQNEIINLKIINSTGQVILERSKLFSKQIILDISTEADGIYFLEVTMADGIYRSKFLKN